MIRLLKSFVLSSLLTERVLSERVFGKQAFIYHGSSTEPKKFVSALLSDKFEPGSGAMYGKGLYTVYEEDASQPTFAGNYGDYVYKLKVNLHGFIVFDSDVCKTVYGSLLSPIEQLQLLGDEEAVAEIRDDEDLLQAASQKPRDGFSSDWALNLSKLLSQLVKGIVFTGRQDGRVAVVYDPASVVPVAWSRTGRSKISWQSVEKNLLKPALRRSAVGQFDPGRFSLDSIRALKKGVREFAGDLDLRGTSITSLPDGLIVDGHLDLSYTNITSLPSNLKVGGDLDLRNTPITSLPDGLIVGGHLDLSYTNITSLPLDLKVGGNLDLYSTKITSLPAGADVRGWLDLRYTKITFLPSGLKVGGDLNLRKTKITSLPADLKVIGLIYKDF